MTPVIPAAVVAGLRALILVRRRWLSWEYLASGSSDVDDAQADSVNSPCIYVGVGSLCHVECDQVVCECRRVEHQLRR